MSQVLKSAMSGNVLSGLPVMSGYNPRGPEYARTIIYGLRGNYKTSFCASNPDALILDWEDGANSIMYGRAQIISLSPTPTGDTSSVDQAWLAMTPWKRYEKVKQALLAGAAANNRPCKTVVIDTLDEMVDVILREFCSKHNITSPGEHKDGTAGWYAVRDAFMAEYQELSQAGYGVWMTAHLRERTLHRNNEDIQVIEPWLFDSVRKALAKAVDQILAIEMFTTREKQMVVKMIAGKETRIPETVDKTVLRLRSLARPENRELKGRVLIPDALELPLKDAYTVYADAYRSEVERVKQEIQ